MRTTAASEKRAVYVKVSAGGEKERVRTGLHLKIKAQK